MQRLRPQQKFPSEAELSAHITQDCQEAAKALSSPSDPSEKNLAIRI
ncbi:MAG TPA: hypothetical protein ENN81_03800 [Phycisphaerales bacterium]|nr:hypothetical protein [Phycisphaerales bacterium]